MTNNFFVVNIDFVLLTTDFSCFCNYSFLIDIFSLKRHHYVFIVKGIQKQPLEVFYKSNVLKNFAKFTGNLLYQSLFFNKMQESEA